MPDSCQYPDQAKEILGLAERMHISLPELANRIAVTPETMRKIANGYQKAGPVVMQAIRNVEYVQSLLREAGPPHRSAPMDPTAQACMNYVQEFLRRCENDPTKLGWFLVELKEHFPLNKWGEPKQAPAAPSKPSSSPVETLAREGAVLAGRAAGIEPRLPEPKPPTGERSEGNDAPKHDVHKG
jgi:hypothetical protein